jgi:hypothetical protein
MKKIRRITYYILFVGTTLFSCKQQTQKAAESESIGSGWVAAYKHDENGNPLEGSIDSLIAGIRNGYDVRVGWGWQKELGDSIVRLEHIAKPLFLTIIQEKSVSIIIDAHPLLASYIDSGNQKIAEGGHTWQCVLTTKGEFNAKVHHRSTGELIKDWPQRQRMTWFLEYPYSKAMNRPPLFE